MLGIESLLHPSEKTAIQRPAGDFGKVEGEHLIAEGLAMHGLEQLVGTLRGTLACRVLDCDKVVFGSNASDKSDRTASGRQSRLPLTCLLNGEKHVEVPINTVMEEVPDYR